MSYVEAALAAIGPEGPPAFLVRGSLTGRKAGQYNARPHDEGPLLAGPVHSGRFAGAALAARKKRSEDLPVG
jgi:hypothetical protein